MKLTDLEAYFVRLAEANTFERVGQLADAQAVMFECPGCRKHSLCIWFREPLPGPGYKRWDASGSGLNDLTLSPSVHVIQPCGWHGFVRNGDIVNV